MSDPTAPFPHGLTGEATTEVVPELTARHLGSGTVSVFATPEMVRLMERAAGLNALKPYRGGATVCGHGGECAPFGGNARRRHRHRQGRATRRGWPAAHVQRDRARRHGSDRRGDA